MKTELNSNHTQILIDDLRQGICDEYEHCRERALALTKLDECQLWLVAADEAPANGLGKPSEE